MASYGRCEMFTRAVEVNLRLKKMKRQKSTGTDRSEQNKSKRLDQRQSAFRAADLVLGEDRAPVSCLVKDISKTGMRLIYDSPHELPKQIKVVLHHPSEELYCEVVWQRGKEIGLRVIQSQSVHHAE